MSRYLGRELIDAILLTLTAGGAGMAIGWTSLVVPEPWAALTYPTGAVAGIAIVTTWPKGKAS